MRAALAAACALLVGAAAPGAAQQADASSADRAAGSASAQPGDTVTLTLAQALDIARRSNPAYQRALNDVSLNAVEMRTLWFDQLLPSASLSLFNTDFTGNLQRISRDDFGNPVENPTADWQYFSRTSHFLSLGWQVQGASLFQSHRRQSLVNRTREFAESRVLSEVQLEVQRGFWDALEQLELTRTEEDLVQARRVDLQLTERLFGLAQRTRVDVLNAELEVERQLLALQGQRAAYEQALLALRTALGDIDLPAIHPADEELPIFDPSRLEAETLVETALRVNPALMESRATVETSRLGVNETRNLWWPQISLGLNLYRRSQTPGGEALFEPWPGEGMERNFFLQFSLPVFNNYLQNRQQQHQASVQLENSVESEREQRLQIEQQVRGQLLELQNQWESLRLTERALAIAEEALALRREEYRLGTASYEDLRNSIEAEAEQRRALVTARHAFVDALLNLEQAVGTEVRE